jgi:CubicO group peptidase (beta-lactamase class C family)
MRARLTLQKAADLGPLGRRCLLHDRARGCLTRSHMLRTWSAAHPGKPIMAADGSFEGRALRWNDAPQGFYFAAGAAGSAPALEASLAFSRARPIPLRSMSKALTAAVMLALQDRGLLSINDPVAKHLPALGAPPPGAAPATLRNLLTHTAGEAGGVDFGGGLSIMFLAMPHPACPTPAGLPEYRVDVENHGPPALTLANISLAAAAGEIVAIWGSQVRASPFLYTALAYQLLGAVAEAAAGKSWHALFAELVARPLRMRDTRFYHYFSTESGVPNPHLAVSSTCVLRAKTQLPPALRLAPAAESAATLNPWRMGRGYRLGLWARQQIWSCSLGCC